jgi:hypothetical protein
LTEKLIICNHFKNNLFYPFNANAVAFARNTPTDKRINLPRVFARAFPSKSGETTAEQVL